MYVTKHGATRMRERVGLTKKNTDKFAEKALNLGIKHSETSGKLNKYITSLYFNNKNANNIRVYNRNVYIFSNDKLITVLNLPKDFWKMEDKIKERKRASEKISKPE